MKQKKGQAAMEFLMTYGWAILVVLAAIGALAYFGILNPGNWLPTKCTISGGFSCLEHKVYNVGTDTVVYTKLQQNLGIDAASVNISVNSTDCQIGGANLAKHWDISNVQNGDTFILEDAPGDNYFVCTNGGTPLSVGQRVRAKFSITYQKTTESTTHETSGDLSSKVEQ
jgi:hypothetical protein